MNNNPNSNTVNSNVDEIDLRQLLDAIWQGKWVVVILTVTFSIASIAYSLSLPDIYKSRALLSTVDSDSSSNAMNSIGGLASIAGINLSAQVGGNTTKAITKLNTLSFFKENILPNIFLPDLMAIETWDAKSNTIYYDKSSFNNKTKTWIGDIPSPQKSHKEFMDLMQISTDRDTGFVTLSIKHQSPQIAQLWIELIVTQLNYFFRTHDKIEAKAAMDFLNTQMAQTSYTEIKQVIAELLQKKMQQLTLIEANSYYVFSYLDPPMVMEEKVEPNRKSILMLGAVFGGLLGILIVISRELFINRNK